MMDRTRRHGRGAVLALALLAAAACRPTEARHTETSTGTAATSTEYGAPVAVGNGTARAYITTRGAVPEEIGIALTEGALSGLPDHHGAGGVHAHGHTTFETVLTLPERNSTPFRHVLMNWNPGGHEPPGIYDLPHFDFHFYAIDVPERLAIDPADPEFQRKAERLPFAELIPQGYVMPAPLAFARMGVHWVDPTSPELNGGTFERSLIYGSWDGRLIFVEPMITNAFLASRQAFSAPMPAPTRWAGSGYYPTRWSIRWDEAAREHRIVLDRLVPVG